MFYGHCILGGKGPLAHIWLAAHLDRKLSRQLVFETDVLSAVNEVIKPKIKMSLRLNGHLLLGIVRIYASKTGFILHDLERAKRIFYNFAERERQRAARRVRNLTAGAPGAPNVSTIPEEDEHGMDENLPRLIEFAFPPGPEYNIRARNSEITLHENDNMFVNADLTYLEDCFEAEATQNFDEEIEADIQRIRSRQNSVARDMSLEAGDFSGIEAARASLNGSNDPMYRGSDANVARLGSKIDTEATRLADPNHFNNSNPQFSLIGNDSEPMEVDLMGMDMMDAEPLPVPEEVIANLRSDFVPEPVPEIPLDPLSDSQIRQELARDRQERRRRRMRVVLADDNTSLKDDEISSRMKNLDDIVVNEISLAPPTKRLMKAKAIGSLQRIFNHPATDLFMNSDLMKLYSEHCVEWARPLSDLPTEEEVRNSMGFTNDCLVELGELEVNPQSRTSSPAQSLMADLHQREAGMSVSLNDAVLNDSLLNYESQPLPANDWLNEPVSDRRSSAASPLPNGPADDFAAEEDRENVNPFAAPPAKRMRTEKEIRAEKLRVQRSTKNLFRLIKNEMSKTDSPRINFNELILPNASTPAQLQQMPQEQRRDLAKVAAHQFYALLELRKTRIIRTEQSNSYQPIFVTMASPNA